MILPWIATAAAWVIAVAAWMLARRTARRLEHLSQMYWELKYQYAELRRQLPPSTGRPEPQAPVAQPAAAPDAFIPLASLKR